MTGKNADTCSLMSSAAGEHLYGTALEVENWFLLEYPGAWKKDALAESSLPEEVKERLGGFASSFGESRIQLIGGSGRSPGGKIGFYCARSSEFSPKLYRFDLGRYEDLLDLDLPKLAETGEIEKFASDEKLVLVCTHGARDGCCAALGSPVFRELSLREGISAWRTTHVGAHRFAANLVMLPEGVYYGRVTPENLDEVVSSHLRGEIFLDCYRGRSCFSQTSQVSDYFLRRETGRLGIYDIKWEFEKDRAEYTAVEFGVEGESTVYSVNTVVMNQALKIRTSCGDSETSELPQFYFYSLIPYEPRKGEETG